MNYIGIRNEVQGWINRPDLASQIPTFVQMAQRRIEREINHSCMEEQSPTTTLTSDSIDLPTNFKATKSLRVTSGDVMYNLRLVDIDALKAKYSVSQTGEPIECYAVSSVDNAVIIRPYPDDITGTYAVEFVFYGFTDDLQNDSDTNWWTLNAWDVLLYGALIEASAYLINDARISTWQAKYLEALRNVLNADIEKFITSRGASTSATVTEII